MTTLSARDRLLALPAVFRGADLTVRFQWDSKRASHYLYLWGRRNLIAPLGGHSDVFVNRVVSPAHEDWPKALRMAMPSATLIGIEALRRAGWTTQIQHTPDVAVLSSDPAYQTSRFIIQKRPASWFAKTAAAIEESPDGHRVLSPAWALADMLSREPWGQCGLWPDDLDWDAAGDQGLEAIEEACRAFGCDPQLDRALTADARFGPSM